MKRSFGRTLAVVALAAVVVVGVAPASIAAPVDPQGFNGVTVAQAVTLGWTSARWADNPTVPSGWTVPGPAFQQDGAHSLHETYAGQNASMLVSEPYWDGTAWTVQVRQWARSGQGRYIFQGWAATAYCSTTPTGSAAVGVQKSLGGHQEAMVTSPKTTTFPIGSCGTSRPYLSAIQLTIQDGCSGIPGTFCPSDLWWFSGPAQAGGLAWADPPAAWCEATGATKCGPFGGGGFGGDFGDSEDQVYEDAADFAIVCADPPVAEWLSFGWIDDWVGHYADCLMAPRAGFRLKPAGDALAGSFVGDVGTLFSSLSTIDVSGTCGVLFDTSVTAFGGQNFRVDTCAQPWPQFAPIRETLGVGLIIMTVLFVIGRLMKIAGFGMVDAQGPEK